MRLLWVLLLLLVPAARVHARQTAEDGNVRLIVVVRSADRDSAATTPIPGAEVRVRLGRTERSARSDDSGKATLVFSQAGVADVQVRSIGLAAASFPVRLDLGHNEVTVRLALSRTTLDPVRVVGGRTVSGRLEDFELRLARRDANAVIVQAQIEKRNPIVLSQMLRGLPGVRVNDSLGIVSLQSRRGLRFDRGVLIPCVLRVMVDGVLMPKDVSIDDVLPRQVYGVELFLGPSRVPLAMANMRDQASCGLLAIWTRSG